MSNPLEMSFRHHAFKHGVYSGYLTAEQRLIDEPIPMGFSELQNRHYVLELRSSFVHLTMVFSNGIEASMVKKSTSSNSTYDSYRLDDSDLFRSAPKTTPLLPVVFLDLETESQSVNAMITSAGLVYGDLATGEIFSRRQYRLTDRQPMRKVDVSTIIFWEQERQNNPHIEQYEGMGDDVSTAAFLLELKDFFDDKQEAEVFGNGPEFDNANISLLCEQYSMRMPWEFRRNESLRTVVYLGRKLLDFDPKRKDSAMISKYVKHFALHDAMHEFEYCSLIVREFMSRLGVTTEDMRKATQDKLASAIIEQLRN